MENTFVIAWRSKSDSRCGQGKQLHDRAAAEARATELNQDYPAFGHRPFNLASPDSELADCEAILL